MSGTVATRRCRWPGRRNVDCWDEALDDDDEVGDRASLSDQLVFNSSLSGRVDRPEAGEQRTVVRERLMKPENVSGLIRMGQLGASIFPSTRLIDSTTSAMAIPSASWTANIWMLIIWAGFTLLGKRRV